MSNSIACGLSIGNEVMYEIVMQKYNNYKKQYQKDQNPIDSFDKLYKNVYKMVYLTKMNMNLDTFFNYVFVEVKNESFL